jgi:drug/metabolite transporter (DMT)-like permease
LNQPAVLYALILLMVAFWSGNYVVGKIALREFPPMLLASVRIGMAGLLILPIYAWQPKKVRVAPRDMLHLLLLGLLGVTLNQIFFVAGLSRTSVAHAALIIGLTPILVLILASLRGLESMTPRKVAGLLIALAGVAILKAFDQSTGAPGQRPTWLGDFYMFLAAVFFALFTVFGKEVTSRYSSITVNTVAYVGGGVALLPLAIWEASRTSLAQISLGAWLGALYMALFSSVIAYLIYYRALTHIAASRVAAFSYLQPVFALILGVVILGESVGLPVIAAGLVILAGVYLAEHG